MRETKAVDPMVLLLKAKNLPSGLEAPQDHVCIRALLPTRKVDSPMGNCKARNEVIVPVQELLLVGVLQAADEDDSTYGLDVVTPVWMLVADRSVLHIATNGVLQLDRHGMGRRAPFQKKG